MIDKIKKSIIDMLTGIDDIKKLERIHRFIEYIYTGKQSERVGLSDPFLIITSKESHNNSSLLFRQVAEIGNQSLFLFG